MVLAKIGSFNKIFFIVIACFFVINAVLVGIEEKNFFAGLEDIGNKLIYSTQQLSESSNEIYSNGFVIDSSDGFLTIIKTYWNLISSFLGVLLWIRIFAWIINGILKLPAFFNFVVGLVLFVLIQIIVLLLFSTGNKMDVALTPITCIWHFVRILPIIFKPFRDVMNRFI